MKVKLYIKKTYTFETEGKFSGETSHSKPMAETKDGKHYPLFTPVQPKEMIGVQEARVLNIRGEDMVVLESQNHLLARLYDTRKFIR